MSATDPDDVVARGLARALESGLCGTDGAGLIGEFESGLATLFPEGHVVTASSGTAAAAELYWALGLGPGDEVVLPAYGFHATVLPLLALGVTPRFVDVDADGTPLAREVEREWTPRTRALVVTHLWGPLWSLARHARLVHDRGGALVADCSHSLATSSPTLLAGLDCDAAFASLNHRKPLGVGEGGVSWVRSREVWERILAFGHGGVRAVRSVEADPGFAECGLGVKHRITVAAAGVGIERLASLDAMRHRRWRRGRDLSRGLATVGVVPLFDPAAEHPVAFHHVPFRVPGWRDPQAHERCLAELAAAGVPVIRSASTRPFADLRAVRDAPQFFPRVERPWREPTCPGGARDYHDRLLLFAPEELPDDTADLADRAAAVISEHVAQGDADERVPA